MSWRSREKLHRVVDRADVITMLLQRKDLYWYADSSALLLLGADSAAGEACWQRLLPNR